MHTNTSLSKSHPQRLIFVETLMLPVYSYDFSSTLPTNKFQLLIYTFQMLLLYQDKSIKISFPGPLRLQDHFLRPGLHAAAAVSQRVQLVPELRRDCSDVERRLHHPQVHLTSCVLITQVCLTAAFLCNVYVNRHLSH